MTSETSGGDQQDQSTFLAVVGMAGRFPGAYDLAGFWDGLAAGAESVTRFPPGEPADHIPAYGVVRDADQFDAAFFGYPPGEALMLDPQHRVFMECAWEALEHTGYDPASYPGLIGIYGGSGDTDYYGTLRAHRDQFPGVSDWQFRIASGADFLTSRVAYKLGLNGPAVTIQTACSTSLVAVHVASQALLAGECDLALAGGVTLRVPHPVDEYSKEGILAADGRCRAFDKDANGTVASDGAGVVALKRLEDAIADGDHIHAVLRGSAVNNDGAGKLGFAAPSVDGQAAAVRAAHLLADVDPATISYVEAHGTGTPVGDPIEVRALTKAFGQGSTQTGFCVLGSVKTNIGHTDAAAGVIGLIKVVLSLGRELIPGTVHFRVPNPLIDFTASPFTVSAVALPWPRTSTPRRAGVNSLGIGGTNAHVVVEEPPALAPHRPGRPYQLLPLSARSEAALARVTQRLAGYLRDTTAPLEDIGWTLQIGRRPFGYRDFVVASDRGDAVRALTVADRGRVAVSTSAERGRPVAFLFPGQGGQHVGMGRDLYDQEPVFRAAIDRCAKLALPELGVDLVTVLYAQQGDARALDQLATMGIGQPALFTVQYALAELWQAWGVTPEVVLGHSLGAYAAATVAGVLSLPDAMALVLERSRLLHSLPSGTMLAVPLRECELAPLLSSGLSIAAINGPAQCVVAGPAGDVAQLHRRLAAEGIDGRMLHVSAAAHSVLVEPVRAGFEKRVAEVRLRPPAIPWISDRTGLAITPEEACDPAYWGEHLRHTVRFSDALQTLLCTGESALLELGPGHTLGNLARQHPAYRPGRPVAASLPHPLDQTSSAAVLLTAVGQLWQAGVPITWTALHEGERRRRTPLPTYPFERQRFRLDAPQADRSQPGQEADSPAATYPAASVTEHALTTAIGEVLGVPDVGAHDNFFDLGGDSLIAVRLVALIKRTLGAQLPVSALFRAPTATQLAGLIKEESS